jgi:Rps23 Pro-64 3,4-dihydroxylase Tpa1-like proline 4-hydroxylase
MKYINVNGVCIYRNAISNSSEIIEASELLNISKDSRGDWNKATVINTEGKIFVSDVRTNEMMLTPMPTQMGDESSAEVMLANKIHGCILPCLQHFNNKFGLSIKSNSTLGYQILKYSIGEHYVSHLDDGERTRRYASAVAYLNDDYEGGELYFQDLNFTYQPVAGDVVIFPSGAPFRHEAKPVISGIKYSIANWW